MKYINTFLHGLTVAALMAVSGAQGVTLEEAAAIAAQGREDVAQRPNWRTDETPEQHDQRMEWWRDARFGMFIHWGVYAMLAGEYKGADQKGVGEWIMCNAKIPVEEYQAMGRQFNPVKYNPEDIVLMAKNAGMKYLVITAKHHDGFCLWESDARSDWSVTSTTWGKDLLQPLAAACKKHGIKFGLYFSHNHDWSTAGGANGDRNWDPIQTSKSFDDYYYNVAVPQTEELMKSFPELSVFWFDLGYGSHLTPAHEKVMLDLVRKYHPQCILNDRLDVTSGLFSGDFQTHEGNFPGGVQAGDWETCMTMDGSWGYIKNVQPWRVKDTTALVKQLGTIVSRGGNYLLNIGPRGDGSIDPRQSEPLAGVGKWMQKYSESIYGCGISPIGSGGWGVVTGKDLGNGAQKAYLHIHDWPQSGRILVPNGRKNVKKVTWLKNGSSIKVEAVGKDAFIVDVGDSPKDDVVSVVELALKGEVAPLDHSLIDTTDYKTTLPVTIGELDSDLKIDFENKWSYELTNWNEKGERISFPTFEVVQPGRMTITLKYGSKAAWAGNTCAVTIGNHTFDVTVKNEYGDDAKKYMYADLGTIDLEPGHYTLSVEAKSLVAGADNLMNLNEVLLQPR